MKKTLIITLLPLLIGFLEPVQAGWQLIDNFEDGDISDWTQNLDDPDIDQANPPAATVVDDPLGGTTKVLKIFPGGLIENTVNFRAHKDIPEAIQISDNNKKTTLYFKVLRPLVEGVPAEVDIVWGLTPVASPTAFSDYSVLGRYEKDGGMDIRDEDNGGYVPLETDPVTGEQVPFETDVYYELWFVMRHSENMYDLYIRGGEKFPTQTHIYTEALERNATFDNLINFLITTSTGNTTSGTKGRDPTYFDDIYIDTAGENLSAPDGWSLLDNFEDGDISDWTLNLTDPDIDQANPPTATAIDDPFGGDGKVLSIFPGGLIENTVNFRAHKDVPATYQIADNTLMSTLYFRVARPLVEGVPGEVDTVWGLTPVAEPSAFSDYSVLGRYEKDGGMDIRDEDNGGYVPLEVDEVTGEQVPFETDVFYELWFVMRHSENMYDLYIRGGDKFPTQTLIYTDALERNATFENLINFLITTSTGNTTSGTKGRDPTYFDDIYIDPTSKNLSSPRKGWNLLDNFEDGDISDWVLNLSDPDIDQANPPTAAAIDNPLGGEGKVLSIFPGGLIENTVNFRAHKNIPEAFQVTDNDRMSTLYFKVARPLVEGVPAEVDIVWGLTPVAEPSAFSDYSVLGRYEKDGGMDIRDEDNGGYVPLEVDPVTGEQVPFETDVFYELWFVMRHSENMYDLYIRGGDKFPAQTMIYTDALERNATFENLINFLITTSTGNTTSGTKGRDPTYFDDIFIDPSEKNLSTPSPAAVTDVFGGIDLGGGFFFSDWYGIYNTKFYPWVFHVEHGWQYVFETANPGEVFLFDLESQDFWFTTSSFQPFTFYSFNRGTFNFYFVGTTNPRQFVDLQTEEFFTIP